MTQAMPAVLWAKAKAAESLGAAPVPDLCRGWYSKHVPNMLVHKSCWKSVILGAYCVCCQP